MNINLHIDRLILDGVTIPHHQRRLLQASMEAELARLLSKGGVLTGLKNGGAIPQVPAKAIQLSASVTPVQLGRQIARSVYGGIGK
ncbi:hypothetical protein [Nitrosovibrio sp. Nv6]|uniref:hypothetical protein n=1 Tax=Nitrosovibrio sp. Nv6 TaxID=1855340 RepID=UPI0008CE9753|nr:hypothetical protein [Nitrosovibrio sp. Nv6]SEO73192.1 hypothetical protein SAMN05216316_0926 [Nitrosovibrio sp. Nv6]